MNLISTTSFSIIPTLITLSLMCQSLFSFHVLLDDVTLSAIDDLDFISMIYLIFFTFDQSLLINRLSDSHTGVINLKVVPP
jgi:hypothetical protein